MKFLLNLLEKYYRWRAVKQLGGIPVLWIIYKPDDPIPNLHVNAHPDLHNDDFLEKQFREVADHIRKYYGDWRG